MYNPEYMPCENLYYMVQRTKGQAQRDLDMCNTDPESFLNGEHADVEGDYTFFLDFFILCI